MFALIDCNNFYCSCERVFNPKLAMKPVIVLSNNDGCAIARSEEAKEAGIDMGMPFFLIEEIIRQHKVAVFSSNYTLYGDMSSRVMETLGKFCPSIEHYSIDEAFLDFSEMKYEDLYQLGLRIRKTVTQHTGIPVTIGIAPTKTLAKMANRYAKKTKKASGMHYLKDQQLIDEVLEYTKVGDIWGIGKQYEKLLLRNGFKTAFDLTKANDEWIRKNMSVVGQRMINELRGTPCIKWEDEPPPKKGICTSRSFGKLVTSKQHLQEAISNYASTVSLKLRKQHCCAKQMHVFIQTNPFKTDEKQYFRSVDMQLPVATNSANELIQHALRGLDIIFLPGFKYLKAGVIVNDIIPEDQLQIGMFDTVDRDRNKIVMTTLDSVNKSFGRDLLRFAIQGYEKKWKLKASYLSQRYTTNVNELLSIKI
ncbi:MAG: Y-family DNA polymerase [Chitinophagaceae bacterium]